MNQTGHDTIQFKRSLTGIEHDNLFERLQQLLTDPALSDEMAVKADGLDLGTYHPHPEVPPTVTREDADEIDILLMDDAADGWIITTTANCRRILDVTPVYVSLDSLGG